MQPEVPSNDGWKEIANPVVSHHRGWPNLLLPPPPPVNPNVYISPMHSPILFLHASKWIKTDVPHVKDKGDATASPSSSSNDTSKFISSHMHLKDDCSHVVIEIQPQGSNQPHANSKKSMVVNSDKRNIVSQSGKYGF
jgi:hypothetical protein